MAIPDYQTVMLPLLKILKDGKSIHWKDCVEEISTQFKLTNSERKELLPSGNQLIIDNRVGWARTYLKKAGLLTYPQRGYLTITELGKKILLENPSEINVKFLRQFPDFVKFQTTTKESKDDDETIKPMIDPSHGTPEEILENSYEELKKQKLDDVIDKIKSCTPQFFEKLVVETIIRMGYGGSRKDAGQAIGQSGDEGIDGIINEDRLGLDVIYLQAKRWEGNVSRPEIQKFAGALQGKRAKKGIFITTSDFTNEAKEFVKNIDAKIILINGEQLAALMWEFNIGFTVAAAYEVKKIDFDFFSE